MGFDSVNRKSSKVISSFIKLNQKQSTGKQKDGENATHIANFASGGRSTV